MPFIPISNTMKVALEHTLNGQLVVNVYHVKSPNPIASADLTAIAAIMKDWWNTDMRANFTTGLSLNRIQVTDMTVAGGEQLDYTTGLPITGSISATGTPNNLAICSSLRTGFSGRSNRGRKYFASVAASEVADNFISTTLGAALLADMISLKGRITLGGYDLVIASLFTLGAPRPAGVTRQVTTFIQDLRIDTQRRRLPLSGT